MRLPTCGFLLIGKESLRLDNIFREEISQLVSSVQKFDRLYYTSLSSTPTNLPPLASIRATMHGLTPFCSTPEAVIEAVSTLNLICSNWVLETECDAPYAGGNTAINRVNSKMMLCAIAQHISGSPTLYPDSNTTVFSLLESTSGFILGTQLSHAAKQHSDAIILKWKKRPFTFSAALSIELSDAVINILVSRYLQAAGTVDIGDIVFLDPCCGSGTTLYSALRIGVGCINGSDISPIAVEGTRRNLEYCGYAGMASVELCDVSRENVSGPCRRPDIIVANLPWGENKFEYFGENEKIIERVGSMLTQHTQVAFITQQELSVEALARAGIALDKVLPVDQDAESNKKRAGKCFVSICSKFI